MTARELATVLAVLRIYQVAKRSGTASEIDEIASSNGEFEPLSGEEIDDLCEKLNFGPVEPEPEPVPEEGGVWSDADQVAALCEGWFIHRKHPFTIERDDEAARFESDEDALAFVRRRAGEGSDLHRRAVAIVDDHATDAK